MTPDEKSPHEKFVGYNNYYQDRELTEVEVENYTPDSNHVLMRFKVARYSF